VANCKLLTPGAIAHHVDACDNVYNRDADCVDPAAVYCAEGYFGSVFTTRVSPVLSAIPNCRNGEFVSDAFVNVGVVIGPVNVMSGKHGRSPLFVAVIDPYSTPPPKDRLKLIGKPKPTNGAGTPTDGSNVPAAYKVGSVAQNWIGTFCASPPRT
jgi:hypothetical protein